MIVYAPICGTWDPIKKEGKDCRAMYGKKNPPEDPPCITCYTKPMDENADALLIFSKVMGQYIMGFSGPISINQIPIHDNMKLYNVKNKRQCFEKVLFLSDWWIKRINHEG